MTDRYAIVSRDRQNHEYRYAVIDTIEEAWTLQTNDFAHAVKVRDTMNATTKRN